MPKTIVSLATAIWISAIALSADTYPRQPAVDAIHYRFVLTLSKDLARLQGEARATLRLGTNTPHIELDFASPTGKTGMTVSAVQVGERAVQYTHTLNRLRVAVPEGTKPGHDLTYTITYAGVPADGLKTLTTMYGDRAAFSENWPDRTRYWLPMIDHPYDKATAEFIVTAPAEYQVASNGLLIEETDLGDGQRRTHWKQSVPLASWLYALAVARFDVHHAGSVVGVPLQTWVFPQDRVQGRALFEETSRRALEFFSDRIGPYPYEKLANVQASNTWGGLEYASVVFYGEKGVASGRSPVVHEIAHQWFGNSVTERDWDDVWLSEGFATYFAHLYVEHFEGRDALVQDLTRTRAAILHLERTMPDTPVVHRNLGDMSKVLNDFVYSKGGWILHMLRGEIGTELFWKGIREYYRRYRDGNASTDDFRQVMEHVSSRELQWFFDQWLTRAGVPRIEGTWRYDSTRKAVELELTQAPAGNPFRVDLEVGLHSGEPGAVRITRISFNSPRHTAWLPADAPPTAVVLDPNTWLLADFGEVSRVQ